MHRTTTPDHDGRVDIDHARSGCVRADRFGLGRYVRDNTDHPRTASPSDARLTESVVMLASNWCLQFAVRLPSGRFLVGDRRDRLIDIGHGRHSRRRVRAD